MQPDFLSACVDALVQHPDAAVCQSDIDYVNESGDSLGVHQHHVPGSESFDAATRFAALVLRPHAVDIVGSVAPGVVGIAEQVKQTVFPGARRRSDQAGEKVLIKRRRASLQHVRKFSARNRLGKFIVVGHHSPKQFRVELDET